MTSPYYIVALDYGGARIGVAIASSIARLPRPLTTLANAPDVQQQIASLVQREQVGLVVVGLPHSLNGGYSQQTQAAEDFGKQLAELLSVPVEFTDEALTSVEAEAELAGKKHTKGDIDALAATYILERYFTENPAQETQV